MFRSRASAGLLICLWVAACGKAPSPEKKNPATGSGMPVLTGPQAQLRESLTQAIEGAEMILKMNPKDKDALLAAALAAEHLNLREKAIQYYARLQESTQETEYLGKLADLHRGTDTPAAARYAARFFEQGGSDDALRYWLIRHDVQKKDYRNAYLLTEKFAPPSDKAGREFLRDLCVRQSQLFPSTSLDALTALRRAAIFAPLPPSLAETVALTFLAAGDAEGARDVMKSHPGAAPLLRAKIAEKLQAPHEALEQRLKYYYSGGTDPAELFVLLESLGRAPPARQVAEQLWRSKPADLHIRLAVARSLSQFFHDLPDTPAEIQFLEEAKDLDDPALLDRLADLQRAIGNAQAALSALRTRYPRTLPDNKTDLYVTLALSAGESTEALRSAEQAPLSVLSESTRRRLSEILITIASGNLAAGKPGLAKADAVRAEHFWPDLKNQKLLAGVLLLESDTPSALARLVSALKLSPGDPEANYLAGKILFSQSHWQEARPYLQMAYSGHYRAPDLPLLLGQIHFSEKSMPMAYPLLKEYAEDKSNPLTPDILELLGRTAMASGHAADAATWFERRLAAGEDEKISSEYLESLLTSGQKARALGQARSLVIKYPTSRPILESASDVFDFSTDSPALLKTLESLSSIESDPEKKAAIQRRLLDVKLRMGRPAEADALLSVLLSRYPNDAQLLTAAWNLRKGTAAAQPILNRLAGIRSPTDPIQLIRARQMLESKNFPGAMSIVRDYLAGRKEDPDGLALQAEIYTQMGNADGAAQANRQLLKIRKDETARQSLVQYIYDQALSSLASGRPLANAEQLYAEAAELLGSEEKYKDLYEVFGKILSREPRGRAQAIDAIQRELRLTKDAKKRMRLTETLGQWYLDDGQLALSKDMFAASQSSGNGSPIFLRTYARLLARIGETEEAAGRYQQVLKQSPFDREANLFMARRATDLGRRDDAIQSLEALRTASTGDSGVLEALASAYAATGRHAEAAEMWRRLTERTGSIKYTARYADALYESGQFNLALNEYRALRAFGAALPPHLRRLAELEQSQGNWAAAEEIILGLLRTGGTERDREDMANLLRRTGGRAIAQGDAPTASRTAERLLALNENDPSAFLLMGHAKLLEGKIPAASESFSRAAALAPTDPRAVLGLAEVEFRQNRPVAAIDYARKALAIDSAIPEAYSLIGIAYQRKGDVKSAYESFKNAIVYSKNRSTAYVRMGDLFLQHAKYNVALEQYRQALAVDPKNAQAHLRNAAALNKLGFTESAMKELLTTMELDPGGAGTDAKVLLSEIFASHGDATKAQELLESAATTSPSSSPSVLFRLGELARRNGDYQKSVRYFRDALAGSGDLAFQYDVMNALGLSLLSLDQKEAAEKMFKEAAQRDPGRPAAYLNLSLLYRGQKNFLAAVDSVRKAIAANPKSPDGYKLLGLIYYESGWEKESLAAFRESLRLRPDQPEIVNIVKSIESGEESEEP